MIPVNGDVMIDEVMGYSAKERVNSFVRMVFSQALKMFRKGSVDTNDYNS